MFWRKKEDKGKLWEELMKLLQIVEVTLAKHETEIDGIKLRLKTKLTKLSKESPEETTEKPLYNDGFDEIRKLNREDGN